MTNQKKPSRKDTRNHVILWPLKDELHFAMIGVREIGPRQYRLILQQDKLSYPMSDLQACIDDLKLEGLRPMHPFPGEPLCFLADRVDFDSACHAAAWVILEMQKS